MKASSFPSALLCKGCMKAAAQDTTLEVTGKEPAEGNDQPIYLYRYTT